MGYLLRPFEYISPADYKLFLEALRHDRCLEYSIVGWEAIGDWFVKMRFHKKRVSRDTLRKYRKVFGMPAEHPPRSSPMARKTLTTNLMLHAWMATQGRALSLPRWHPFRISVTKQPSQKPSAVRMTRLRDRRRASQAAAASRASGSSVTSSSP